MTKMIDPQSHAIADYSTAASFLCMAAYYRHRHPRASMLAMMNAASILMLSAVTDYPGGLWRKLSFRTHGAIDVVLTAVTAAGPALFGFARDAEARAFYAHAAGEAGVVAATDFSRA